MSDEIKYWRVRTDVLRDLRESENTLLLLAKHLELETGNENPVEYLRFIIDNASADVMEMDAKHKLERAEQLRTEGPK